jgi:arylsulfatase A-like enzyme
MEPVALSKNLRFGVLLVVLGLGLAAAVALLRAPGPQAPAPEAPAPEAAAVDAELVLQVVRRTGSDTRPNILLVVFDTTRAQQMGAWGYPLDTTPNLDQLAARGVRFENFYSNASWTRPGFAAIFTGRYGRSVGVYEERFDRLPEDAITMAEYLQDRGYLTLGVTSNPNTNELFGFSQGFDEYADSVENWRWMKEVAGKAQLGDGVAPHETAAQVNARVVQLLARHAEATAAQPYFLHLVYMEPHTPRYPPQHHLDALAQQAAGLTPPLERAKIIQEYDAELRSADEEFGRLLEVLQASGRMENTLVIVTSDHGEGLLSNPEYPGSRGHGHYLTEALTRVPLIIQHPSLPAGKVVVPMASTIDLLPTLAALIGDPVDAASVDGRSLVAELRGEPVNAAAVPVFSETDMGPFRKVSLRTESHTFIVNDDAWTYQETGAHELRRLKPKYRAKLLAVPHEELYLRSEIEAPSRNLLTQQPAIASRLRAMLDKLEQTYPRRSPTNRSSKDVMVLADGTVVPAVDDGVELELGEGMEAQLRALGYVGD